MKEAYHRNLSEYEYRIIEVLLSLEFPGRDVLHQQLKDCTASPTGDSDNYGSIYLHTSVTSKADVVGRIPVEAFTRDSDGGTVDVLLHVLNGYLNELEIIKSDGTQIQINELNLDSLEMNIN